MKSPAKKQTAFSIRSFLPAKPSLKGLVSNLATANWKSSIEDNRNGKVIVVERKTKEGIERHRFWLRQLSL